MEKAISKEQEPEFIERWESGELAASMADYFGCARGTIYATARYLDLTERGHGVVAIKSKDEDEFKKRYLAGDSVWSIAVHFGCGEGTVWSTALRLRLPVRPTGQPRRRFTDDDITNILRQWDDGVSISQIRKTWHASHPSVIELLQSHGRDTTVVLANRYEADGYVRIKLDPDDPMFCMANGRGYVQENRLVMARDIGRPLLRSETVHHIDGNGLNNDIGNLQLRSGNHGKGIVHQCFDCGSHNIKSIPIADTES